MAMAGACARIPDTSCVYPAGALLMLVRSVCDVCDLVATSSGPSSVFQLLTPTHFVLCDVPRACARSRRGRVAGTAQIRSTSPVGRRLPDPVVDRALSLLGRLRSLRGVAAHLVAAPEWRLPGAAAPHGFVRAACDRAHRVQSLSAVYYFWFLPRKQVTAVQFTVAVTVTVTRTRCRVMTLHTRRWTLGTTEIRRLCRSIS